MHLRHHHVRWILVSSLFLVACSVLLNLDGLAVRFGGTFGIPISNHSFWLPRELRLALSDPVPEAAPGPLVWTKAADGFDTAWLDVMVGGKAIDAIGLARIDPSRHRFSILQEPSGKNHLEDWMRETGAELIVNASYYDRAGKPATPVVNEGVVSGPLDYQSSHGAFAVTASKCEIADLRTSKWPDVFKGAEAGLVSYPLLLSADGTKRTVASQWLANRSFIGVDQQGRVIIGTTRSAFFSLDRLALFLKIAIPELKAALNLDGGPVASQAIAAGDVRRTMHGRWELQAQNGHGRLLPVSFIMTAPMPIVIAVFSREKAVSSH
jgi:Phosphodiester glycosidase